MHPNARAPLARTGQGSKREYATPFRNYSVKFTSHGSHENAGRGVSETVTMKFLCQLGLAFFLVSLPGCGGGIMPDLPDPPASKADYSTKFPATENPISEGGKWVNGGVVGLDWTDVFTTSGLSFGLDEPANYADATAVLQGLTWAPDQKATGVVSTIGDPLEQCFQEVELRLRTVISAHSITGYEINYKFSNDSTAYMNIVRWNGPFGNFTTLKTFSGQQFGVKNGDVVSATVVGNVITAFKNGVQQGQVTDTTYSSGSPGIGFNLSSGVSGCAGTGANFGFSSFAALDSTQGSF
jgi:hypothetical protein